ncbi:DUF6233 domain-containing protein [Streptomyces sp. NRRL S-920]|uniref:DUF6233 domain-containing protein n=1 Tax=Streptomyces sp. NRRL S-920 TaxID=1463921 RepID=UPI00131E2F5D|nr:DUF6233 domain-containing protein [Streptomyces sp. NRRL S-920]
MTDCLRACTSAATTHTPKWPRALGVSREQAREALYQQVLACPHCHPDKDLGVVDSA